MRKLFFQLSIILALSLLSLNHPNAAHAATFFQDVFTDVDNTELSQHDPTWVHSGASGTAAYILNNQLTFPFINGGSYTLNGFSSNTDQCVSTDYNSNNFGGADVLLNVRNSSNGRYELSIGDGFWLLKKKVNSTSILLGSGSRKGNFDTVTSLKICVVGSTVNAFLNNTVVKSVIDSSISQGTAGISANQPVFMDNFVYTDGSEVSPYPTPVPPNPPTASPTPPVLFEDAFTDINTADLSNHNSKWVNQFGHAYIWDNKLNFDYFDSNFDHFASVFYTVDGFANQTDQCVAIDFDYNGFWGDTPALRIRYSANSRYELALNGGGTWFLRRWNSSTATTLASGSYDASTVTSLKVCAVGSALAAYINGALVANEWDDNISQGTAGLFNNQTALLDNFLYTDGSEVSPFPTPPNTTPIINTISNTSISEGGTYTASGSFTDPSSTSWTATVNYGDGAGAQPLTLNPDKTFSLSHLYKDNGTYTVTVSVTDNQGAIGTKTATVTVNNVASTVGAITASINPVMINTSTAASANFTDAGVLDTHTASWNWGDGNTTTGTVTESNGSGSVSDSHAYAAAGVYTITLTITDNNNASSSSVFQYLTVYDTAAGWVTGGKEYTSPAGAVIGNAGATGKADFGFTAKYVNGSPIAIGNQWASLTFKIGNTTYVDFNATAYESLVVTGSKAILRGTGTLNGVSGYSLLISAIEGATSDFVRYQIKNSSGNIIYDTQQGASDTADPTTVVTKGKIDVH
ncbi:MAG: PKD domain-containing protein [Thermoproteota archaeon]|nr:PKD domain-containing protein [Thermoproteota archaeon]